MPKYKDKKFRRWAGEMRITDGSSCSRDRTYHQETFKIVVTMNETLEILELDTNADNNEIPQENLNEENENAYPNTVETSSSSTDNVEEVDEQVLTQKSFSDKLREWAINGNIELTQISKLLRILVYDGNHMELPLDARSLLKTPRAVNVRRMDNGYYVHLGIKDYLNSCFECFGTHILSLKLPHLQLSFNMDGTPISTSGGTTFWPILGSISNVFNRQPVFIVGIFSGLQKPESYNNYLLEFVEEMKDLMENGFLWNGIVYPVKLKAIICDAPAMAFVKAIKSHGDYYCCSKCYIKGEPVRLAFGNKTKIIYPDLHSEQRTDEAFRARKIISSGENDTGHHMNKERSILEQLPIDMIKAFPVDKMHLVDEGVVKKIVNIWLGKPGTQKLQASKVTIINQHLKECYPYTPIDFQRKPRSFKYAHFFKASECRILLLYTGPIVLRNVLPKETYEHFMSLSLAVRILTSPLYYKKYNEYAHSLLVHFVKNFIKLYGKQNVSYNVHGLLHLAEDAKHLGSLDENSCYLYEAFIKVIKKKLHSFNRPLQQCSNRMSELKKINLNNFECENKIGKLLQGAPHCTSALMTHPMGGNKFMTASFHNFKIRTDQKSDNCIMLRSKTIIRVKYFEKQERNIIGIEGQVFINSSRVLLKINREMYEKFYFFIGNFKDKISKILLRKDPIICKMCCLPIKAGDTSYFFVVPINHTLLCE